MPYFYQHTNGQVIEKPALVVNSGGGPWDYFTGPFVQSWWFENDLLRPLRTPAPPEPVVGHSPLGIVGHALRSGLALPSDLS